MTFAKLKRPAETLGRDTVAAVAGVLALAPIVAATAAAAGIPIPAAVLGAMVGTMVVTWLSGNRFLFVGPTTSLVVATSAAYLKFGYGGMALVVGLAGALQLLGRAFGVMSWLRLLSPQVLRALMTGMGIGILVQQLGQIYARNWGALELGAFAAALVFLSLWKLLLPAAAKVMPAVALVLVGCVLHRFGVSAGLWPELLPSAAHETAASLASGVAWSALVPPLWTEGAGVWRGLDSAQALGEVLALAASIAIISAAKGIVVVASLSRRAAKDKEDSHVNLGRELLALGVGNVLCGVLGAMPVTAYMDRSLLTKANGGRTRMATALQGVLLGAALVGAAWVFSVVPAPILVAIVVYTCGRIVERPEGNPRVREQRAEIVIYAGTLIGVLVFDLTGGMLLGVALSCANLVAKFARSAVIRVLLADENDEHAVLELEGAVTFLALPRLTDAMHGVPRGRTVIVDLKHCHYLDVPCVAALKEFAAALAASGGELVVDSNYLARRMGKAVDLRSELLSELRAIDRRKNPRPENVGRRRSDAIIHEAHGVSEGTSEVAADDESAGQPTPPTSPSSRRAS
jgi:MFS superfamily sulfate permease-like transporter